VFGSKYRIIFLLMAGCFLLKSDAVFARDDFQFWNQLQVKTLDTKYVDLLTLIDNRIKDDATTLGVSELSEKIKYDFWKNLSLGTNYTYVSAKAFSASSGRDELKFQHRLEFEVTPHGAMGDWLKFDWRNRVEFRWIEDNGADNMRYRSKMIFEFPVKNHLPLKSISVSDEFYYDQNVHEYNENWLVPVGLNFQVNAKTTVSLYSLIQMKKGVQDWSSNQVLGTMISTSF